MSRTTYRLPRLRDHREKAVLTQEQLAKLAATTARTISRIELGGEAEARTLQALAKALKCKPADLMEPAG